MFLSFIVMTSCVDRSSSMIQFLTPVRQPQNSSTNVYGLVIVRSANWTNTTQTQDVLFTGVLYEYTDNPTIDVISPKITILSGGVPITITGTNLNSSACPVVNGVVKRNETVVGICSTQPGDIDPTGSNNLTARTPNFKCVNLTSTNSPEPITSVDFFLGFRFDGVNIRNESTSKLTVYNDPIFQTRDISYDRSRYIYIDIQGSLLLNVATQQDYQVSIGIGTCQVVSVTDNLLKCEPPENEPVAANPRLGLELAVLLFQHKYVTGHVKYVKPSKIPLIVGLAVVVGVFGVLMMILTVVIQRKRTKDKRRE